MQHLLIECFMQSQQLFIATQKYKYQMLQKYCKHYRLLKHQVNHIVNIQILYGNYPMNNDTLSTKYKGIYELQYLI